LVSFTFSPGYDIHIGKETYADEFGRGEQFVKNFVRYHYKVFYNERIKSIQEKIDSKQKDIESNDKKIERNNKAIADINKAGGDDPKSKAKSDKLKREIDAYSSDSSTKRDEISALEGELEFNNVSLRKVEAFK
jgi:seryl-tRNA synthetase